MSEPKFKEHGGHPGIDNNLGLPWFGLKYQSIPDATYAANIPTLNRTQWQEITYPGGSLYGLSRYQKQITEPNSVLLATSDVVTVVLDGRADIFNQGYLGDVVEASRVITPLQKAGKKVRVITSHTDVFEGATGANLDIVGLPADLPPANRFPWNPRLLRFIGNATNGDPVLFPVNARVPIVFDIDNEGDVKNISRISEFNRFINQSDKQIGIRHEKWAKHGVHQLQALQSFIDMLGIDSLNWSDFPDALLQPDRYSRGVAQKVISAYHCFYNQENGSPLFLHPGVATDGKKQTLKGYSEGKWKESITEIAGSGLAIASLTLLRPIDQEQSLMAIRLAEHARKEGLKVSEVPMDEIVKNYGWSLGSFIAFLQDFSFRKGVILGCDSMPAGHAAPATGIKSVVLGSPYFNPTFFAPPKDSLVVMPKNIAIETNPHKVTTENIEANQISRALAQLVSI